MEEGRRGGGGKRAGKAEITDACEVVDSRDAPKDVAYGTCYLSLAMHACMATVVYTCKVKRTGHRLGLRQYTYYIYVVRLRQYTSAHIQAHVHTHACMHRHRHRHRHRHARVHTHTPAPYSISSS